jgi:hypothetical protein
MPSPYGQGTKWENDPWRGDVVHQKPMNTALIPIKETTRKKEAEYSGQPFKSPGKASRHQDSNKVKK